MNPSLFKKQYRLEIDDKREWWQELGKEMTAYFGKNCYWIFWKYPSRQITRAWDITQKEGDRDFRHFMNRVING